MIFIDKVENSVVVAIRGTSSFKDVLTDLDAEEVEFLNDHTFAHSGVLDSALRLLDETTSNGILKNFLQNNPEYQLVFTGHSLGGGTAILASMLALSGRYNNTINPSTTKIKCVALGPPPVFRSDSIELEDTFLENIHIFINDNDIVPRLSLGSIYRLLSTIKSMDKLMTTEDFYGALMLVEEPSNKVIDIINDVQQQENNNTQLHFNSEVLNTLYGEWRLNNQTDIRELSLNSQTEVMIPQLKHPGQVYYFDGPCTSNGTKIEQCIYGTPDDFFNKVDLHFDMVTDHSASSYAIAFNQLRLPLSAYGMPGNL